MILFITQTQNFSKFHLKLRTIYLVSSSNFNRNERHFPVLTLIFIFSTYEFLWSGKNVKIAGRKQKCIQRIFAQPVIKNCSGNPRKKSAKDANGNYFCTQRVCVRAVTILFFIWIKIRNGAKKNILDWI